MNKKPVFSVAGRRQSWTETKSAGEEAPDDRGGDRRERTAKTRPNLLGSRRRERERERERERVSENLPEREAPEDGRRRSRRRH